MKIEIGNKNKIKKSNIGSNVITKKEKKPMVKKVILGIIIAVIAGIMLLFIEYWFNITGVFS